MDNMRRAICFETPDYIPMNFVINASCWEAYPQDAIFELMESHPLLFPGFRRPAGRYVPEYPLVARKGADFTDDFGCVWRTTVDGITGTVVPAPAGGLGGVCLLPGAGSGGLHGHRPGGLGGREGAG